MAVKDLMIAVKRWSLRGLLVLVVLFGLYTWLMLSWSYAEGERAGVCPETVRERLALQDPGR